MRGCDARGRHAERPASGDVAPALRCVTWSRGLLVSAYAGVGLVQLLDLAARGPSSPMMAIPLMASVGMLMLAVLLYLLGCLMLVPAVLVRRPERGQDSERAFTRRLATAAGLAILPPLLKVLGVL